MVTPALSASATTEPNISSILVHTALKPDQHRYLHTSPELAMKRLLAAGSGAIYQLCTVFRDCDFGTQHRPEFSMLEWYRPDWTYQQLMDEVSDLIVSVASPNKIKQIKRINYRQLFQSYLDLDPFLTNVEECRNCCLYHEISVPENMGENLDPWLDLLLSIMIVPKLPADTLSFIYDYPASQAALAQIRSQDGIAVAERFELYWGSIELANGFQELTDATEQAKRFEYENHQRRISGKPEMPVDKLFLSALKVGLPMCSGVALGLDRLLMALTDTTDIAEVITFDDKC